MHIRRVFVVEILRAKAALESHTSIASTATDTESHRGYSETSGDVQIWLSLVLATETQRGRIQA